MFNPLKKTNVILFTDFYLFFKKSNRRLEFNDTGVFICWHKRGDIWLQGEVDVI